MMLALMAIAFQDLDIEQKLKDAPDSSYSIGVFIGTILPFVVLIAIAYAVYRYHKNKTFKDE